jgi:hypothetical protein
MTKKKKTTLLVLLVVLIYAAVALRFFILSDGDSDQSMLPQRMEAFTPEKVTVAAQFTIINDYRDPFLGTLPSRFRSVSTTAGDGRLKKKEVVAFPSIFYKGLVADAANGKRIFALEIEKREYVVTQGKIIKEVRVVSGDEKAITVLYKGSKKTYQKHQ